MYCFFNVRLLNSDGEDYKKVAGPFFDLPSSLLEDIIQVTTFSLFLFDNLDDD